MTPSQIPHVLGGPSWRIKQESLLLQERARLSYDRAKAIGLAHNITVADVATLSTKFWDMHADPITCLDGATTTLLTIQYNLAAGIIIQFSEGRPDLSPLIDDLLKFRKIGQFMLTEVGQGLDIDNMETTATLMPSGEFILHSPTPSSYKYMPPSIPVGTPAVAIVFAKLLVNGEDFGLRPFLVSVNDGKQMCVGVTSRLLPYRELASPVNHAITAFNNVILPPSALLGFPEKSETPHLDFLQSIWRVAVGGLALASVGVPACKIQAFIGAKYSLRRTVGNGKTKVPILYFRTQQIPIFTALAQAYVLEAFQKWAVEQFCDADQDLRVRHGVAVCMKAISVQHAQAISLSVSERCGAQGLQAYNMMTKIHAEVRGISIAEGDILVLSLRLAMELLLERYELPQTTNPSSLLSLHEAGLLSKYRQMLNAAPHHRSPEVNNRIVQHSQRIIEAIGHRMAYDAACAAGVSPDLLALYTSSVMQYDPGWYVENGVSVAKQEELQADALDALLPQVEGLMRGLNIEEYVRVPIVSDEAWQEFMDGLTVFSGNAIVPITVTENSELKLARL